MTDAAHGQSRYVAWLDDGSQLAGRDFDFGSNWESAQLDGRPLFPEQPLRWLRDNAATIQPPAAWLELANGDVLPGRIVGVEPGGVTDADVRLLVEPALPLTVGGGRPGPLPVAAHWLTRVVAHSGDGLVGPGQVRLADGRTLAPRSWRWVRGGLKLLTDAGLLLVSPHDIAQLAVAEPPRVAALLAEGAAASFEQRRLARLHTTWGAVLTTWRGEVAYAPVVPQRFRLEKFERPASRLEYVQPLWAGLPLRVPSETVAARGFRDPEEAPLSLLPVRETARRRGVGVYQPWRRNGNLHGAPLASGAIASDLGLACRAHSELTVDLPPGAVELSGWVGLDRSVGLGGCALARIVADGAADAPLWSSDFLLGGRGPVRFGPLDVAGARQVTLVADLGHEGRPPGADPLDIRDEVDWLAAMVVVDSRALRSPSHVTRLGPGWDGWTVGGPALDQWQAASEWNVWEARWDWGVALADDKGFTLARKQRVWPYVNDVLELSLTSFDHLGDVPPEWLTESCTLQVDGQPVPVTFELDSTIVSEEAFLQGANRRLNRFRMLALPRVQRPAALLLWWDLQAWRGREATLELTIAPPRGSQRLKFRDLRLRGVVDNLPSDGAPPVPDVPLASLEPLDVQAGRTRGVPRFDRSPSFRDEPLRFLGQQAPPGSLGMLRSSQISFAVAPHYRRFVAVVGSCQGRSGPFRVLIDGDVAWQLEPRDGTSPARAVDIPLPAGAQVVTLETGDEGGFSTHCAWAYAGFTTR